MPACPTDCVYGRNEKFILHKSSFVYNMKRAPHICTDMKVDLYKNKVVGRINVT